MSVVPFSEFSGIKAYARRTMLATKINNIVYHIRRNLWRLNWKKLFYRQEDIHIDRPVFLLGTQGGGLTLISCILRHSKGLVSCTGNARYWRDSDEMQNVCHSRLPNEFRLEGHPAFLKDHVGAGWRYASDRYFDIIRQTKSAYSPEIDLSFKKLIRDLILFYTDVPDQARFIDKSQSFTLKIPLLEAIFSEEAPYFLLITRNPYAMCMPATMKTIMVLWIQTKMNRNFRCISLQ